MGMRHRVAAGSRSNAPSPAGNSSLRLQRLADGADGGAYGHRGSTLTYRESTELAECIRIMGPDSTSYCRETVLGEKPPPAPPGPPVTVTRVGGVGTTFLSTEAITLNASVPPTPAGTPPNFLWTVTGLSPDAGNGNPHVQTTTGNFTFQPNPVNRPDTGARVPNDPIRYQVDAESRGTVGTFILEQDETDIIRQEYIDLGPVVPPARNIIVAPAIATYNTGNYGLIVDNGMDNARNNTETEFQNLTPAAQLPAPAIGISSGYRNPRRNVAVGSHFPVGSRHVWGRALDLTIPAPTAVLWARLRQAGAAAGNTSICEDGPIHVPCGNANVDHVHIQW